MAIIDTNVYLSRWPARRLPADETPVLVAELRAKGVIQAWAGSFDALLHKDMAGVNERLAHECRQHDDSLLLPIGSVNPELPDWEEDLRRCHEEHKMRGVRLHPNYHGYRLDEPAFEGLAAAAAERRLLVQIAIRMEDPRTQQRLLQTPDVDPAPLVSLLGKLPGLRVQLLNSQSAVRADVLDKLIAAGGCYLDIAMLEGVGGLEKLLAHVPLERVLFGSYYPFFAWEAAELKLRESSLAEAQREAIVRANAAALM